MMRCRWLRAIIARSWPWLPGVSWAVLYFHAESGY